METVTSRDGTEIAFDRVGQGPPVILVSGGSVDRMSLAGLSGQLSSDLTVLNYDRRGRGPSGDTPPYAIEREIEDIEAVIEAAGGEAGPFRPPSGGGVRAFAPPGRRSPRRSRRRRRGSWTGRGTTSI